MNCLLVLYAMCIAITIPNISGLNIFKTKQPTELFKEGNCDTFETPSYTLSQVIYLDKKNPLFVWSGTTIIGCIKIRSEQSSKKCDFNIIEGGVGYKSLTLRLNNPSRKCKYYLDLFSFTSATTTAIPPGTTEAPSTATPDTTKYPSTVAPDTTEAHTTVVPDTIEDLKDTNITSSIEASDTVDF